MVANIIRTGGYAIHFNLELQVVISIAVLLLLLFAGAGTASAEKIKADFDSQSDGISNNNIIYLKSGDIDTDLLPSQDMFEQAELFEETEKYYIVQFEGHVTQDWKDAVSNLGADLFDYLPNNAYVVRMSTTEAYQVASLEFISWIGEYLPEYKYSSKFTVSEDMELLDASDTIADLIVVIFDSDESERVSDEIIAIGGTIISSSDTFIRIELPQGRTNELAVINGICWFEKVPQVSLCNDVAADIINVNEVHANNALNGSGQIIAVCDTGLDTGVKETMHLDIRGRIVHIFDYSDDGPADYNGHGTSVTGCVLGNGAISDGAYKGMAPEASLVFQAVEDADGNLGGLNRDLEIIFKDAYVKGARIHTNSWGSFNSAYMGYYSVASIKIDRFVWNNPDMLILFSAGNYAEDADYNGVVDKDSITTESTSKNVIAVGASENYRPDKDSIYGYFGDPLGEPLYSDSISNDDNGIAAFSSRGPTDDGRIKPDLVAPGTYIASTKSSLAELSGRDINTYYTFNHGTSFSTPIVAGAAAIVREYYTEIEHLQSPSAALLKATLINGAYDITPGQYGTGSYQEISGRPDTSQGWGRVDIGNSILASYPEVIAYYDYIPLSDGRSWEHTYGYIQSGQPVRATLVWTDYPSSAVSSKTPYNDLDMTLSDSSGTYYGNGAVDHVNNIEGIELDSLAEGDCTIKVNGYNIQEGPQNFALVFSFTCDNNEYPSPGSDAVTSTSVVSTDIVHPGGVNLDSVIMEIDSVPVNFTAQEINDGYSIQYNTSSPYQSVEHSVSVTAQTSSGQQFSYSWDFSVLPSITGFTFTYPASNGVVNETAKTITLTVPYGTDMTSLTPTIVHNGASISPGNGVAQDFTDEVIYTVTAYGGATQSYTVIVNEGPSTTKSIVGFRFTELAVEGLIDETSKTISLTVPYGTDVTALTPSIEHTGAGITPDNGTAQDFTTPVTYTVSAEDGSTQDYVVTVIVALNPAKEITGFIFTEPAAEGVINGTAKTIDLTVPHGTNVTALVPTITHTGETITPNSGVPQDFTDPVTYTVTAEDLSAQNYTVTVNVAPSTEKAITDFRFTYPETNGSIDEMAKTITLAVPYGTDVIVLVPVITHTGASIIPADGSPQNFTSPVTYTVVAEDGSTQNYTVTVNVAAITDKAITNFRFIEPDVDGIIEEAAKTITLTVPDGTNVTLLVPSIIHTGVSIYPGNRVVQDFTSPIIYTVTAGDMTVQNYTVSVKKASSSTSSSRSSGGGGGGGGGTTGEKYENIAAKEVESIFVIKGAHVTYELSDESNAISSVQFDSLKNSGTIQVIVEVLRDRSSFADTDAPGNIYQQMNIWVGKAGFVSPENVENMLIGFKVEKSWLEENNIDADMINLYRYADSKWSQLSASVTKEDDKFVYFESQTPGFSPFAIASEVTVAEDKENELLESIVDAGTETVPADVETGASSNFSTILKTFGGVIIIILLAGAYVVYKKRS